MHGALSEVGKHTRVEFRELKNLGRRVAATHVDIDTGYGEYVRPK